MQEPHSLPNQLNKIITISSVMMAENR
ncbi:hypothetical protein [Xenorhabdus griffiniae]